MIVIDKKCEAKVVTSSSRNYGKFESNRNYIVSIDLEATKILGVT
jgi:hypothetical protein